MRSYQDPCGIARALDHVGERWALLVVRELLHGPKRFADLRRGLPGLSQNVLSQRLRELEASGIVVRRRHGPPTGAQAYELTAWGRELEPALRALGRWGGRAPLRGGEGELSVDALAVALETNFAGGDDAAVGLWIGDDRFVARVRAAELVVERGEAPDVTATLVAPPGVVRALMFGRRTLADALAAGDAVVDGDPDAAARFLACFSAPVPV